VDDVRVAQGRDRFRLALEPVALGRAGVRPGQDHLQRDDAVQVELPGLVHDAHPAAADLVQSSYPGTAGGAKSSVSAGPNGTTLLGGRTTVPVSPGTTPASEPERRVRVGGVGAAGERERDRRRVVRGRRREVERGVRGRDFDEQDGRGAAHRARGGGAAGGTPDVAERAAVAA
jgi:hypothetical protein